MTETKKEPSRKKKFLKFLFIKFPIILLALGLVFYITLKLVERYPVPLREGLEEYISGTFGASASIGKMNKFAFVPMVDVDIEDVTLHRVNNAAQIDLKMKSARITIPFWGAFLGQNKFEKFEMREIVSEAGVILPQSFNFDRIGILEKEGPDQYGQFIIVDGIYGNKDFNIEAKIKKNGDYFQVPMSVPFVLTHGDLTLNGTIERKLRRVILTNGVINIDGEKSSLDDYVLVKSNEYTKNNPLSCILEYADGAKCREYLKIESE